MLPSRSNLRTGCNRRAGFTLSFPSLKGTAFLSPANLARRLLVYRNTLCGLRQLSDATGRLTADAKPSPLSTPGLQSVHGSSSFFKQRRQYSPPSGGMHQMSQMYSLHVLHCRICSSELRRRLLHTSYKSILRGSHLSFLSSPGLQSIHSSTGRNQFDRGAQLYCPPQAPHPVLL